MMKAASPLRRLLVIDDDHGIRYILGELLRWMGYEVSLAASGTDALTMLPDGLFDGVLLDLVMPGMSGKEVLHEIRTRGFTMPVIIISGYEALASDMLREGAQAFLVKPIDTGRLRDTLALHLG
ncbi:MAG TPA: response regulator [Nitrospira sp.]|nr:response regulator [Nitrospira sp.]